MSFFNRKPAKEGAIILTCAVMLSLSMILTTSQQAIVEAQPPPKEPQKPIVEPYNPPEGTTAKDPSKDATEPPVAPEPTIEPEIENIPEVPKIPPYRVPVSNYWISSEHGPRWDSFHDGIDFATGYWEPIYPVAEGVVVYSGWQGVWVGCGWWVAVRHEQLGVDTIYCHQVEAPPVTVGQHVTTETIIGHVGSTGWSTGPHLHLAVYPLSAGGYPSGVTYDPRQWLREYSIEL